VLWATPEDDLATSLFSRQNFLSARRRSSKFSCCFAAERGCHPRSSYFFSSLALPAGYGYAVLAPSSLDRHYVGIAHKPLLRARYP